MICNLDMVAIENLFWQSSVLVLTVRIKLIRIGIGSVPRICLECSKMMDTFSSPAL